MGAAVDPALVADAVASVRAELSDRGHPGVAIVAVTKAFGLDAISAACDAGCEAVGENYAQELLGKIRQAEDSVAGFPPIPVHFIGHIQSNKVRQISPHVAVWQSVDRAVIIDEIARRSVGTATVMIQVNATGEMTKEGCSPREVPELLTHAISVGVTVSGLMTIGPTGGSNEDVQTAFRLVRSIADELDLPECSMGMSGDYLIAADCGSTMVRLGSALFGARLRPGD